MKYTLILLMTVLSVGAFAQEAAKPEPPYKRFPTLPPLQLLLGDSTTKFTKDNLPKKKPVLLMVFSPDCEHCQHETEEMVANKDKFKDIQVVMATFFPIYRMNKFAEDYKVKELPNVVIGHDQHFLLPPFYDIRNFPFLALYNKNGDLINTFEGSLGLDKILQIFKDNQ
jgi:thioredoxin-related protein